jgi:hypothetical protein
MSSIVIVKLLCYLTSPYEFLNICRIGDMTTTINELITEHF